MDLLEDRRPPGELSLVEIAERLEKVTNAIEAERVHEREARRVYQEVASRVEGNVGVIRAYARTLVEEQRRRMQGARNQSGGGGNQRQQQEMIEETRASPRWADLEALAPTLAYDSEVMGDRSTGGAVPRDLLPRVAPDALVLVGTIDDTVIGFGVVRLDRLHTGATLGVSAPNGW